MAGLSNHFASRTFHLYIERLHDPHELEPLPHQRGYRMAYGQLYIFSEDASALIITEHAMR